MINSRLHLATILSLMFVAHTNSAFFSKTVSQKRSGQLSGTDDDIELQDNRLFFKGEDLLPETIATRHGSIFLECEVGGTPTPTIHWLKNGVRLLQGSAYSVSDDEASYEDTNTVGGKQFLRLSSTRSRLYLGCLREEDEAQYTCVAENAVLRKSRTTFLKVVRPENALHSEVHECNAKSANRGEPARINMWTVSRLEFEDSKIQLLCRSEGSPSPTVTWYDRDNKPIENDETYRVAENGDLIISGLTFMEHMGVYTCSVDNGLGTDVRQAFVYPTPREQFDFPFSR